MGDTCLTCRSLHIEPSLFSAAVPMACSVSSPASSSERAAASRAVFSFAPRIAIERVCLAPVLCTSSAAGVEVRGGRYRLAGCVLGSRANRVYDARGTTHEGPLGASWGASEAPPPTPPAVC